MGVRLNRLDEPVFIAVSKPLLTEFGIHHKLESCGYKGQDIAASKLKNPASIDPIAKCLLPQCDNN